MGNRNRWERVEKLETKPFPSHGSLGRTVLCLLSACGEQHGPWCACSAALPGKKSALCLVWALLRSTTWFAVLKQGEGNPIVQKGLQSSLRKLKNKVTVKILNLIFSIWAVSFTVSSQPYFIPILFNAVRTLAAVSVRCGSLLLTEGCIARRGKVPYSLLTIIRYVKFSCLIISSEDLKSFYRPDCSLLATLRQDSYPQF